jgi:hypothetical protein
LGKDNGGKPNENHDHSGAIKYVPESEVFASQILAVAGFRPPFMRLRLARVDDTGPLWIAKHAVNPRLGHRVGIATKWGVFEDVDTKDKDHGPVFLADGGWSVESGEYQIGTILAKGTILLEPGAWPRSVPQPASVPNREPEPQAPNVGAPAGKIPRK